MGRRDSGTKRKTWMIESGDWEKLYEALLKAKEKNNMLDVRLRRKTDLIEMQRRHRDKALFNDIFEQRKLVFKYKGPGDTPRSPKGQEQIVKMKDGTIKIMPRIIVEKLAEMKSKNTNNGTSQSDGWERLHRKLTLPNLSGDDPKTPKAAVNNNKPTESFRRLTLPTVTQTTGLALTARPTEKAKQRPSIVAGPPGNSQVTEQYKSRLSNAHLQRYATMPNLHLPGEEQTANKEDATEDDAPGELWVGEPIAIGSVRRPRLKPEEMSAHTQPRGEARKLLIELSSPNKCSRNCGGSVRTGVSSIGGKDAMVGPGARPILELTRELTTEEILSNIELVKFYTSQALSARI